MVPIRGITTSPVDVRERIATVAETGYCGFWKRVGQGSSRPVRRLLREWRHGVILVSGSIGSGRCRLAHPRVGGYELKNEQTVRLMIKYANREAMLWGGDV